MNYVHFNDLPRGKPLIDAFEEFIRWALDIKEDRPPKNAFPESIGKVPAELERLYELVGSYPEVEWDGDYKIVYQLRKEGTESEYTVIIEDGQFEEYVGLVGEKPRLNTPFAPFENGLWGSELSNPLSEILFAFAFHALVIGEEPDLANEANLDEVFCIQDSQNFSVGYKPVFKNNPTHGGMFYVCFNDLWQAKGLENVYYEEADDINEEDRMWLEDACLDYSSFRPSFWKAE